MDMNRMAQGITELAKQNVAAKQKRIKEEILNVMKREGVAEFYSVAVAKSSLDGSFSKHLMEIEETRLTEHMLESMDIVQRIKMSIPDPSLVKEVQDARPEGT